MGSTYGREFKILNWVYYHITGVSRYFTLLGQYRIEAQSNDPQFIHLII